MNESSLPVMIQLFGIRSEFTSIALDSEASLIQNLGQLLCQAWLVPGRSLQTQVTAHKEAAVATGKRTELFPLT